MHFYPSAMPPISIFWQYDYELKPRFMLQSFHASLILCSNLNGWGSVFRLDKETRRISLSKNIKMHQVTWTNIIQFIQLRFSKDVTVNSYLGKLWMWIWSGVMVGWPGQGAQDGCMPANIPGGQGRCVLGATKHYTDSQYRVRNVYLVRDNFQWWK